MFRQKPMSIKTAYVCIFILCPSPILTYLSLAADLMAPEHFGLIEARFHLKISNSLYLAIPPKWSIPVSYTSDTGARIDQQIDEQTNKIPRQCQITSSRSLIECYLHLP